MAVELNFAKYDSTPWGFRLTGGSDYGVPLTVIKVYEGCPAENIGLMEGDQLYQLNGECMMQVTHEAAHEIITRAGNNFQLAILRGQNPQYTAPTDQPDPFGQNTLDTAPATLQSTRDLQPLCQKQAAQVSSTIEHRFSNNLTPTVYRPFSKKIPSEIPPLENPLILSPNHLDEFQTIKQQEWQEMSSNFNKKKTASQNQNQERSHSSCSTGSQQMLTGENIMAQNRLTPKGFRSFSKTLPSDIPVLENPLILSPNHLDEFQTIKQKEWKENSSKLLQKSYNINQTQERSQSSCSTSSQKKLVEEELIVTGKSLIDLNEIENSAKDVVENNLTKAVSVVKDSKIVNNERVNIKNEAKFIENVVKDLQQKEVKLNACNKNETKKEKRFESSVVEDSLNVKETINRFSKTILDSSESGVKNTTKVSSNEKSKCSFKSGGVSLEDAKSSAIHAANALSQHAGNGSLKVPCAVVNIKTQKQTDMLLKTFFVHLTDVMVALTQMITNDESLKCCHCNCAADCKCVKNATQEQSSAVNIERNSTRQNVEHVISDYASKEMSSMSTHKATASSAVRETGVKKPPDERQIIVNGSAETGRIMREVIQNTMGVDVTVEGKDPLEWLADLDGRKTPNYYISKVQCIQTGVVDDEVQEVVDDEVLTKKIDEEHFVAVENREKANVKEESCAKIEIKECKNEAFETAQQKVELFEDFKESNDVKNTEENVVTIKMVANNVVEKSVEEESCAKIETKESVNEKFESLKEKVEVFEAFKESNDLKSEEENIVTIKMVANSVLKESKEEEQRSEMFESVSNTVQESAVVESRVESEKKCEVFAEKISKSEEKSAFSAVESSNYKAISNQHQESQQTCESYTVKEETSVPTKQVSSTKQESSFSAAQSSTFVNIESYSNKQKEVEEFSETRVVIEETRQPVDEKDVSPSEVEEIVDQAVVLHHGKEAKPKDPQTPNTDEYVFRLDVKLDGRFSKSPDNVKREYVKQPSLHEDLSIVRRPGFVIGDVNIESSSAKQDGSNRNNVIIKDPLGVDGGMNDRCQIKGSTIIENEEENTMSACLNSATAVLDSSSESVGITQESTVTIPRPGQIINAAVEKGGQEIGISSAASCKLSMESTAVESEQSSIENNSSQQTMSYTVNEDILSKIIQESDVVSGRKAVLSTSAESEQKVYEAEEVCSTVESDTKSTSISVENEQKLSSEISSLESSKYVESEKKMKDSLTSESVQKSSLISVESEEKMSSDLEMSSVKIAVENEQNLEVTQKRALVEISVENEQNFEVSQQSASVSAENKHCSAMKNSLFVDNNEHNSAMKKKVSFSLSSDTNNDSKTDESIQTAKSVEGLKQAMSSHSKAEKSSSVDVNAESNDSIALNVSAQESQVTSAQSNMSQMASMSQHDGGSLDIAKPPLGLHDKDLEEAPKQNGLPNETCSPQTNGALDSTETVNSEICSMEAVKIEEASAVMTMGAAQKGFASVEAPKITNINGNGARVEDEENLGKPGITDEEIAVIISGEAEVLKEQHVLGVDFGKMMPTCEYLKRSEVFKLLNDEAIKTAAEKMQEMRKYTKFLQRPDRPVPFCKRYVDQLASEEPPYRVNIKKQPKKEQDTLGHSILTEGVFLIPEVPILVPEPTPQYFEAPEYLADSSFPDLEDTGIPIPEFMEDHRVQEIESTEEGQGVQNGEGGGENEGEVEEPAEDDQKKVAEDAKDWDDPTLADEELDENLPVAEQLLRVQKQLTALSKLPAAIQQTLDLVTKQLGKMVPGSAANSTVVADKEQPKQNGEEATENGGETQQDGDVDAVENESGHEADIPCDAAVENGGEPHEDGEQVQELVVEHQKPVQDNKTTVTAEKMEEAIKIQEQDKSIEKIKKDLVAELSKDQAIRKRGPRPAFGPLAPQPRAMVLPGGRRWRKPKDAYDDAFIAETLTAQASIITGTTLGKFESDHLPYDDRESNCHLVIGNESMRVNFMKYEKPPIGLEHLKNSSVFKLVHEMDTPLQGIEERNGGVLLAESEYRERCRSVTPSSLNQNGNGVPIETDS